MIVHIYFDIHNYIQINIDFEFVVDVDVDVENIDYMYFGITYNQTHEYL